MTVSRRNLLLAGGGIAGIALLGAGAYEIFRPRREPTPYDDILGLLSSREDAAEAGRLTDMSETTSEIAERIRRRLDGRSLADICTEEAAQGHTVIIDGWLISDTVRLICVLASRVISG